MKSCSPVPWQLQVCSGHGDCSSISSNSNIVNENASYECVCLPGWGSVGDLSLVDGIDCNVSYDALRALWAIAGILGFFPLGITMLYLNRKYKAANEKKKRMSLQEPVILFPLMFFIMSLSMIISAIFYVIDPRKHYLGGSLDVSFTITIFTICFFQAVTAFLSVFARFFHGYAEMLPAEASHRAKKDMILIKRMIPFYHFFGVVIGLLPLCIYFYQYQVQQIATAFYLLIFLYLFTSAILLLIKALNPVIREIDKHLRDGILDDQQKDVMLETVVNKMKMVRLSLLTTTPPAFVMYILLALVPYIQRNTCYVIPLLFITGALTAFFSTYTLVNGGGPSSSKPQVERNPVGSSSGRVAADSTSQGHIAEGRVTAPASIHEYQ